jgi:hypothetical protein
MGPSHQGLEHEEMIPDRFSAQACSQNSAVEPNSLMMPTGAIAAAHYAESSDTFCYDAVK